MEDARVSIAQGLPLGILRHQVRVTGQRLGNAAGKLLRGRNVIFKGNGGICYIGGINFQQRRRVLWARDAKNIGHLLSLLFPEGPFTCLWSRAPPLRCVDTGSSWASP